MADPGNTTKADQCSLSTSAEPVLRALPTKVPDKDAIDAPVPESRAATGDRMGAFVLKSVSHVVVQ